MLMNRCPLWFGQQNRWVLRRSLHDKPSDLQILNEVAPVIADWFRGRPWEWGPLVVTVRELARRRRLSLPADCELAACWEAAVPHATMLGDSFASVVVEFSYFGTRVDMPWPARDARGEWLHHDAVWLLDAVGTHGR